ncbi:bifunctional UDP-N-acetylmuramoyl-tripeptide:D-alanyl-D-alanine ligase/alanine racemase [Negadavirga shengliensis]|uniref:Alanine racemase n=1 Tax=Negadavirga shengliensis TaxID=1389218 RepID=A0ABV9T583_9BACT
MMDKLNLRTFAEGYPGKLIEQDPGISFTQVAIDSRKIFSGGDTLFIGLKGNRLNGRQFSDEAHLAGTRNFLLSQETPDTNWSEKLPGANIFLVENPLDALQQLAIWNRNQIRYPIVGITGSNGKTIIKEWLGQILSHQYRVGKSPKSYNSQIGVPLSALSLESYHQIGILEAGISEKGEMEKLNRIIRPELGIFTNLGTAHDENFTNAEEKLIEKCKLFSGSRYIIYRKDQKAVADYLEKNRERDKLISWSEVPGSDYTLSVKNDDAGSRIVLIKPDLDMFTFYTAFRDSASLENLRHVIVACLTLGMKPHAIQKGIATLRNIDMRLTLKPGINRCNIIDDTYNNDLAGLEIALEFMGLQRQSGRKILILSDMVQAGNEERIYQKAGKLVGHYGIDFFIGVGERIKAFGEYFGEKAYFFRDTSHLLENLQDFKLEEDLILIKGARKFYFEEIVKKLEEKFHGTVLEINLNAISHNFNFYKQRLASGTKVMVMVKAFAYGGGSAEIANHLQSLGADYLAVAYADEGVYLRQKGIRLPIMVMNTDVNTFHLLDEYRLEPVIYSIRIFNELIHYVKNHSLFPSVHLELETGMRRLGIDRDALQELASLIHDYPELKVASLYTHLAGADEAVHDKFTQKQLQQFSDMCDKIIAFLGYTPLRHVLNSAGIIRYPEYAFDMVRLGIGVYGVEVSGREQSSLQQVFSLKTVVSQIKELEKGDSIGYGRKGMMTEKGRTATIAIGYADGFDRRFSNGRGYVLIRGQRAPVIGNVCMDMTMVDISGIDAKEGDTVIVYGENIPIYQLAENIGTIPYELLTNIGERVKRLYYLD